MTLGTATKPMSVREQRVDKARRDALNTYLQGRASAASANLSRSYGLPVAEIQKIMRSMGVADDG